MTDSLTLPPAHHLKIALVEPEIPQNVGNIARLCAVTGSQLHLVRPLGFVLSDRHLRRAGMDYLEKTPPIVHDDLHQFKQCLAGGRYWLCTARAGRAMWNVTFSPDDWLIFGKETQGLPRTWLKHESACTLTIPMIPNARCLNVSSAAAVVLYEALRQIQPAAPQP